MPLHKIIVTKSHQNSLLPFLHRAHLDFRHFFHYDVIADKEDAETTSEEDAREDDTTAGDENAGTRDRCHDGNEDVKTGWSRSWRTISSTSWPLSTQVSVSLSGSWHHLPPQVDWYF